MGLTLHYEYGLLGMTARQAEAAVRRWHAAAEAMGFDRVNEVFHETFDDQSCDEFGAFYPGRRIIETGRDAKPREPEPFVPMSEEEIDAAAESMVEDWEEKNRRIEAGLEQPKSKQEVREEFAAEWIDATDGGWLDLHPHECWFFWVNSEGSEPLILGLARYPAVVEHEVKGVPDQFETGLGVGWHWQGFCKTQYASLPEHGGDEHFIQTHLGFCRLLDTIAGDGMTLKVQDDGGYWDDRDEEKLRREIRRWNGLVASIGGRMKDSGLQAESPIFDHPEFEHLEAEGEADLDRRRAEGGD